MGVLCRWPFTLFFAEREVSKFPVPVFFSYETRFFFFKLKNRFYFICCLPHYFVENCRVILFMSLYLTGHIFTPLFRWKLQGDFIYVFVSYRSYFYPTISLKTAGWFYLCLCILQVIFLPHYFVENCRVILFMSLYLTGHIFTPLFRWKLQGDFIYVFVSYRSYFYPTIPLKTAGWFYLCLCILQVIFFY